MIKFREKIKSLPKSKKVRYFVLFPSIFLLSSAIAITFLYIELNLKKTISNPVKLTFDQKLYRGLQVSMSSGPDAAIKEYDTYLSSTTDPKETATLYLSKAGIYFDEKQYDKALEFVNKADSIESTENTSHFLARIYTKMGNNQKAIDYYNRAIDFIEKDTEPNPLAGFYTDLYKSKIKELE